MTCDVRDCPLDGNYPIAMTVRGELFNIRVCARHEEELRALFTKGMNLDKERMLR